MLKTKQQTNKQKTIVLVELQLRKNLNAQKTEVEPWQETDETQILHEDKDDLCYLQ